MENIRGKITLASRLHYLPGSLLNWPVQFIDWLIQETQNCLMRQYFCKRSWYSRSASPLDRELRYFANKIIYIYVSYFVTDSGGHPLGGSIQCGSKRRVALQFVIASVTSSVITLRARCQGNSCNCPGLGTRIPHATFYTIYYICHLLYIMLYMLHCRHYTIYANYYTY